MKAVKERISIGTSAAPIELDLFGSQIHYQSDRRMVETVLIEINRSPQLAARNFFAGAQQDTIAIGDEIRLQIFAIHRQAGGQLAGTRSVDTAPFDAQSPSQLYPLPHILQAQAIFERRKARKSSAGRIGYNFVAEAAQRCAVAQKLRKMQCGCIYFE